MSELTLKKLHCKEAQRDNENFTDEVYIIVTPDGDSGKALRIPADGTRSMHKADIWTLNIPLFFNTNVEVDIYEGDGSSKDDTIGKQSISATTPSPVLYDNNCYYYLYFSVS